MPPFLPSFPPLSDLPSLHSSLFLNFLPPSLPPSLPPLSLPPSLPPSLLSFPLPPIILRSAEQRREHQVPVSEQQQPVPVSYAELECSSSSTQLDRARVAHIHAQGTRWRSSRQRLHTYHGQLQNSQSEDDNPLCSSITLV